MTATQATKALDDRISEQWHVEPGRITRRVTAGLASGTSVLETTGTRTSNGPEETKAEWDQAVLRGATPQYERLNSEAPQVRILDLFCGGGGLTLGVSEATRAVGLKPIIAGAIESNRQIFEVYERNFHPRIRYVDSAWGAIEFQVAGRGDTARFIGGPRIVAEELAGLKGSVDVILGGPPCQGHSNLNNRSRRNDPRNILYLALPAFAAAVGARCVIIENVPDIVHDKGLVVQSAITLFESLGYVVTHGVVDGSSLGVPQTRRRHMLIAAYGSLPDISDTSAALATPVRPVRWAIEDLFDEANIDGFDSPAELSEVNRDRIRHLYETELYDMPNHKRPPSHQEGHTYPSVYGRLHWDKPAGTITTGFLTPGRGRFIHPDALRTLTPHEAARLQGFPDSFIFRLKDGNRPTKKILSTIIGDAVPPNLGYVAGLVAFATMDLRS